MTQEMTQEEVYPGYLEDLEKRDFARIIIVKHGINVLAVLPHPVAVEKYADRAPSTEKISIAGFDFEEYAVHDGKTDGSICSISNDNVDKVIISRNRMYDGQWDWYHNNLRYSTGTSGTRLPSRDAAIAAFVEHWNRTTEARTATEKRTAKNKQ